MQIPEVLMLSLEASSSFDSFDSFVIVLNFNGLFSAFSLLFSPLTPLLYQASASLSQARQCRMHNWIWAMGWPQPHRKTTES